MNTPKKTAAELLKELADLATQGDALAAAATVGLKLVDTLTDKHTGFKTLERMLTAEGVCYWRMHSLLLRLAVKGIASQSALR